MTNGGGAAKEQERDREREAAPFPPLSLSLTLTFLEPATARSLKASLTISKEKRTPLPFV